MAGSLSRFLFHTGLAIRETGQALDKLGCFFLEHPSYREEFWRHRTLIRLVGKCPTLGKDTFVAPSAAISGNVTIGDKSSVWYGAVLRGDKGNITVGSNTNIQDGVTVKTFKAGLESRGGDCTIGNNVTIGHSAVLNACTVSDNSLVGIGAVLREGVVVGSGAMVAAGAVVPPHTTIPQGQLWAGNPAVYKRDLSPDEVKYSSTLPSHYVDLAAEHNKEAVKSVTEIAVEKAKLLSA